MIDGNFNTFDLTYEEAEEKIKNGAILIDVRTKKEYEDGHAKGSINIPVNELEKISKSVDNKNREIILYCKVGSGSEQGKMFLKILGYINVFNLGGLNEWKGEFK